jgi:hypothetical protein
MNRTWCEREFDVVQALRTGVASPQLRAHIQTCAVCVEAQAAAQVMLQTASQMTVGEPPAAGLVWRRAQARKEEIALQRATRPLIVMRALGVIYVVLSAAWFLRYSWSPDVAEFLSGWKGLRSGTAYVALSALVVVAVGAWYMLHDSRRASAGIPSL